MKYQKYFPLFCIFIGAFLIRLIHLNQSLWLDEAIVVKVIRTVPFFQIPIRFSPGDFHPPLYYLFMSLWSSMFGISEIALRMPSVIFSLITGWFILQIGTKLKNSETGIWAALFFLFNPLIIYYSQEARMYMLATLFVTGSLYYFFRIRIKAEELKWNGADIILFNVFSFFAVCTFYGSIFFLAGMIGICFLTFSKGKKMSLALSVGTFLVILILLPLLLLQLNTAKVGLLAVKNWSLVLGKVELKNFALIFLKFATGRVSWYPKWSYYLVSGVATAVIWVSVLIASKKQKILSFLFILPLVFALVVSFFAPMMMYFRFLYLLPVISILLALFPLSYPKIKLLPYLLLFIFIVFSFLYLFNPIFHREDWQSLTKYIASSVPLYMILPSSDPVSYYRPTVSLHEIRDITKSTTLPRRIQVVPYIEEIYGYDHFQVLKNKGCFQTARLDFRGPLSIEEWQCANNHSLGMSL